MKINSINNYNQNGINFNSSPVRNISAREKHIVQQYVTGLGYRLKMSGDDLAFFHKIRTRKQLEKQAYEYIAKKMDIPQEILPPLVQVKGDGKADYSYAFLDNTIQANVKLITPKNEIFSTMRHEFQHFMQICNILRTEGIGNEALKFFVQATINDHKEYLKDLIKKSNYRILNPEEFPDAVVLNKLREALYNNDQAGFDEHFKPLEKSIEHKWQQIKDVSVNHWGSIKENSYEGKRSAEMFEELINFNPDADFFDYVLSKLEKDAFLAETFVDNEYNGVNVGCYVQKEKQLRAALDKDETFQQMQKIAKERMKAPNKK